MLKAIFRILKILFLMLFVLPLSYCVYHMKDAEKVGKKWCEESIVEFENQLHTQKNEEILKNSYIRTIPQKPKFIINSKFFGQRDGYYECSFGAAGGFFPTTFEYTSDTKKWKIYD